MSNALNKELIFEDIEECEWCGEDNNLHIFSITRRVIDQPGIRADSIVLCEKCLKNYEKSKIPAEKFFIRIAIREQEKLENVFKALSLPIPITLKKLEEEKDSVSHTMVTIATHIDYLVELSQKEKDLAFVRGEIIKRLVDDAGVQPAEIAREIGRNKSFVVQHLKMRRAFPDAEPNDNQLLVEHYMTAATTNNPDRWLEEAEEKGLSPGALKSAYKDIYRVFF